MDRWLINGASVSEVAVTDRGLNYGDGLFETVAIRNGSARFIDYHLERLSEGAKRLSLSLDVQSLLPEIAETLEGHKHGVMKLMLTRGSGPRGYRPEKSASPMRIMGISETIISDTDFYQQGINLRYCETPFSVNPVLAGMKTLNRLEQVLAQSEWEAHDVQEGLMSTLNCELVSGTMTNVFIVKEGELQTPDLSNAGIAGVMRRVVIEQANRINVPVRTCSIYRADLEEADEVFVTNSLIGLWPVKAIENQLFKPGAITRSIMGALAKAGVQECEV
ncbi:MAG: aminodeoxychorismate lyase [Gammaproteobacteria bacterium]|nr:aminodeoxychorismate lyase [Gammaproteobacteria bacterium]